MVRGIGGGFVVWRKGVVGERWLWSLVVRKRVRKVVVSGRWL